MLWMLKSAYVIYEWPLSEEQLESKSARIAVNGGRAFGVMIGCLLGMFPLLFYASSEKDEESNENVHNEVSSNK